VPAAQVSACYDFDDVDPAPVFLGLVGVALLVGFLIGARSLKGGTTSPAAMTAEPVAPSPAKSSAASGTEDPVEVTLTGDAIARVGIKTAVARSEATSTVMSLPGTVTSNAYRETKITALVGGIVRSVTAELGAQVSRGQPLAVVFSSDLADAQMKYLAAQAMLEADHQKRVRTEALVRIGAASRQELEEVVAVHSAHEAELAAVRQRLILLGLSRDRVDALRQSTDVASEVTITAPSAGTVIIRLINPGQVLTVGQEMFVVADLGNVWIIGDLYEKDFASVRVGSEATVVVPATGQQVRGRVSYIDPRVDPGSRTAKVRVEVPNADGSLRLGMFVDVRFSGPKAGKGIVIPRTAVQSMESARGRLRGGRCRRDTVCRAPGKAWACIRRSCGSGGRCQAGRARGDRRQLLPSRRSHSDTLRRIVLTWPPWRTTGFYRAGTARSWRRASRMTRSAELPNMAAMTRPTTMSGHPERVTATAPAARSTPTFAITSLREHNQADRMLMSWARCRDSSQRQTVLAANATMATTLMMSAVGTTPVASLWMTSVSTPIPNAAMMRPLSRAARACHISPRAIAYKLKP
jgi:RND family efflux transporter MFP subunit